MFVQTEQYLGVIHSARNLGVWSLNFQRKFAANLQWNNLLSLLSFWAAPQLLILLCLYAGGPSIGFHVGLLGSWRWALTSQLRCVAPPPALCFQCPVKCECIFRSCFSRRRLRPEEKEEEQARVGLAGAHFLICERAAIEPFGAFSSTNGRVLYSTVTGDDAPAVPVIKVSRCLFRKGLLSDSRRSGNSRGSTFRRNLNFFDDFQPRNWNTRSSRNAPTALKLKEQRSVIYTPESLGQRGRKRTVSNCLGSPCFFSHHGHLK